MSKFYLKERDALNKKNAGSKARNDVETIVSSLGWQPLDVVLPYKENQSLLASIAANGKIYAFFRKQLSTLKAGDALLVQFPPRSHSVLFPKLYADLRCRGVHVTFLIHDLERMRYSKLRDVPLKKRIRILLEETRLLKEADVIICHNGKMKTFLEMEGFDSDKLVPLGIFDYLTDCGRADKPVSADRVGNRLLIAGNLSPEKCVYLTELQEVPDIRFNLYGVGYEDLGQENVTYMGSFLPDELVGELDGDFGLVWDGTSIDTCTGIFGNYLRLNDPHKLSLYLTAGLPVVVWSEAAVADFVRALSELTPDDYNKMAQNASVISKRLRSGHYLTNALSG